MKTLIIDNYDSFTYNLYQLVATINKSLPRVIKNDEMSYEEFLKIDCDNIIISPGPGKPANPADFGLCTDVIKYSPKPILGVCLGHQGLAHAFSAEIIPAPKPMHGRVTTITHHGHPLFEGIPKQFQAVRYHSLMIAPHSLPECFTSIAVSEDGLIMAIAHNHKPLYGVQFHPESIASQYGKELIENFNRLTAQHQKHHMDRLPASRFKLHVKKISSSVDTAALFQSVFSRDKYAVWLDSNRLDDGMARFSFMGCWGGPFSYHVAYNQQNHLTTVTSPGKTQQLTLSIFDYLRYQLSCTQVEPIDLPFEFHGGFIGYFGYELKQLTLPVMNTKDTCQDAQFLFLDRFIVIDHMDNSTYLACLDIGQLNLDNQAWVKQMVISIAAIKSYASTTPALKKPTLSAINQLCGDVKSNLLRNEAQYLADIARCKQYIREGESYEVCLTNKIKKTIPELDLLDYYQQLRIHNPAPYSAFLRFDDMSVACSSMERFLLITPQGLIETKPIKGTLPRTIDPDKDKLLAQQLTKQEKFFSENLMIVDLLRNDLGAICQVASVHVAKMMDVESYATVHQLVSTIRGKLRPEITLMDCIKNTFPGGSITGAPKIRTVEIIDSIEQEGRGIYTGSIGYLSLNGAADLNIVIRTVVKEKDEVTIGIGGAIIDMSCEQEEFDEILLKSKALLDSFRVLAQQQPQA